MDYGTLYVVATPIGNLGDFSPRAVETLRNCDLIACEDTRPSSALLKKFGISAQLVVYEDSRERVVAPMILEKLKSGKNVGLISDAGTPCVSDPGFRIVRLCRKESVNVIPVAGPCAFIAALSASGLPSDSFLFVGFLPSKTSARKNFFEKYKTFPHTLIFYESPYRIEKFADDALEVIGPERYVCFAKEISKLHETFFVGRLSDVCERLKKSNTKGEFTVLIAPESFEL